MELWNSADGTVETIVDELPQEVGKPNGIAKCRIISVNDNSELVFIGGYTDNFISDIWKFRMIDLNWQKLGDLSTLNAEHDSLAVSGLSCQ